MGYKRGRRNAVDIVTHRPEPEPLDCGTEQLDDAYAHTVGFNLALFVPHVTLIRDQLLKSEGGASKIATKQTMLYVTITDQSPQSGNAMIQAKQALEHVIIMLDRSNWRPPKRATLARG